MADALQKHMRGTDDSAIETALQPKELGFNETTRNSIYKHLDGVTFDKFFSENTLGKTTTPSGATLIGVDSSAFTQITGINVQALFTDVDTKLNAFPWILTKTSAELKTSVTNANKLNIFHIGPQVLNAEIVTTVTSDKNIWGFSQEQLSFASSSFGITFPTLIGGITDGTTAFVRFYTPCTTEGSAMFTIGGIDKNTTGIKLVGMTEFVGAGSTNAQIEYEIGESNAVSGDPNVICVPWSGLNQILKPVQGSWRKQAPSPGVGFPTFVIDEDIAVTGTSAGIDIWVKNYKQGTNVEFTQAVRRSDTGIAKAFLDYIGGVVRRYADEDGHFSIDNLPNDWWTVANSFDLGAFTFMSASNNTSYFGSNMKEVANGDFRFSTSGFAQRISLNKTTGIKVEEVSSVSGAVDDPIVWVETKRTNPDGNISHNGATIPSVLSSLHFYTFFGNNTCTFTLKTSGDTTYGYNMYFDGTNFVSIAAGESARVEEQAIQMLRYVTTAAAGGSGSTATAAGQILTTALIYQQTYASGNVNIKTGGTYTSTL